MFCTFVRKSVSIITIPKSNGHFGHWQVSAFNKYETTHDYINEHVGGDLIKYDLEKMVPRESAERHVPLTLPATSMNSYIPRFLFYSFFKSLVGKDVVVELKNDLSICGTLHSVDQFLNIKLTEISVTDPDRYPHMLSVKNCFIRGSVVRYVQLPADECDTQILQDAARKEAAQNKQR